MGMEHLDFTLQGKTSRVVFTNIADSLSVQEDHPLIVTDQQVYRVLMEEFDGAYQGLLGHQASHVHQVPSGETAKEWDSIAGVLQKGFDLGLGRDALFIGVGGGVVTDMTAFAASVYMRGCRVILVPTTLLAMVDAAFGGKTGMNFGGFKNMVGTFYPAEEVRIAPEFLRTLPEAEFRSGLAEVIKSALLDDPQLLTILETESESIFKRNPRILDQLVRRSIAVKGRIVEADLTEQGIRAHLNLGHTFAHALEAVAGFGTWSHGEAVAWGIQRALRLGEMLSLTSSDYRQRVEQLLLNYGYQLQAPGVPPEALFQAMKQDKKKQSGTVRFVLQKQLGKTMVQPVSDEMVMNSLREGC
jgi:3-dehydroquinate synthase